MRVVFKHPPTGTANQFVDFDPTNVAHYPPVGMKGIYIYGIKVEIEGIGNKFVPMYVGIGNLRTRLQYHYNQNGTIENSKKELFHIRHKMSINEIEMLYKDMNYYNNFENVNGKNIYIRLLANIKSLIWYRFRPFFKHKTGITSTHFNAPIFGIVDIEKGILTNNVSGHNTSVMGGGDFDLLPLQNTNIENLRHNITETKQNYTDNFYYVFADFKTIINSIAEEDLINSVMPELPNLMLVPPYIGMTWENGGKFLTERVEYATKIALNKIGIYTTADAKKPLIPMEIDLSNVQDVLVDMGSNLVYPYTEPLIISLP